MKSRWIWAGIGTLVGLGIMVVMAFARPYTLHGSVIEPARAAPSIELPASDGETFTLEKYQGKILLMFFGYTSCPDVCPATLSEMRQVMAGLKQQADQVQIVFVTVDPQRDTVEKLNRYLSVFGARFIGLSGSETQLEPVWKGYGVYRQIQPVGSTGNYTVDHSAFIYVIDAHNRLKMTYPFGTDVKNIIDDILYLLKEG